MTIATVPSVAAIPGSRSAHKDAPNSRTLPVISQIISGGLVFHRSGAPCHVVTIPSPRRSISSAFTMLRDSSHRKIGRAGPANRNSAARNSTPTITDASRRCVGPAGWPKIGDIGIVRR